MYRGLRVAVVIPAFREQDRVAQVVAGVPDFVDWILVVDDASPDATAREAARKGRAGLVVLRHARNAGVGRAIATGYREARRRGADVAVVMAGDGQMDPNDLTRLLEALVAGADYAKGNRFADPEVWRVMPLDRLVGNVALSLVTRLASGYPRMFDSQCGYTALRLKLLDRVGPDHIFHGYGYCNDLLCRLHRVGAEVVDVPVRPIYNGAHSGIRLTTVVFPIGLVLATAWLARLLVERGGRWGRWLAEHIEAWKWSRETAWWVWRPGEQMPGGKVHLSAESVGSRKALGGTASKTLMAFAPRIFKTTRSGMPERSRASVSLGS